MYPDVFIHGPLRKVLPNVATLFVVYFTKV